ERHPAARAAAIEAEHQPRAFRRAAMDVGIHAQAAMATAQQRRPALDERKAGPPHQRPVAKDPEFLHGGESQLTVEPPPSNPVLAAPEPSNDSSSRQALADRTPPCRRAGCRSRLG